ncbi:GFA family protein [Caulobacter sp. SSI4214]|uniref:GFA family protein n=1 Tax=Caulobacter sp. SSI4214 TaxID=2575739 RepID=UPI001439E730|nr:GFA family protein [Caulobacter sp. SSI4214]
MIIKGSCCCGSVRFELFEPPALIGTCHCSRCRKAGSSTYVFVRAEAFSWTAGRDLVTRYHPRPPFRFVRAFCRRCGSALGDPGNGRVFAIAANCLDDDPGIRTGFHEYTPDKPPWREGPDDP